MMDIPDFFDFPLAVKIEPSHHNYQYNHMVNNLAGGGGVSVHAKQQELLECGQPFIYKPYKVEPSMSSHYSAFSDFPREGRLDGREKLLHGQFAMIKLKKVEDEGRSIDSKEMKHGGLHGQNGRLKEENLMEDKVDVDECSSDDGYSEPETGNSDVERRCKRRKTSNSRMFAYPEKLKIFQGSYPCNFCPTILDYAPELALHESLKHSVPSEVVGGSVKTLKHRYFCPRCSFSVLGRQRYLNHHLKDHLNLELPQKTKESSSKFGLPDVKDSFPCDVCQRPLSKSNPCAKRDHYRLFHDVADVDPSLIERCDLCPAYFIRGIQLIRHKQQYHDSVLLDPITSSKRYPCQSCNKVFYYLPQLWAHRRDACEMRHTFVWMVTCSVEGCTQKFESTAELDYHVTNTHSSDKLKGAMVECPTCGRMCMGNFGLIKHMQCHNPNQDHLSSTIMQCQLCGEKLKSRLYFNRHMKRHLSNGDSHICEHCGKTCDSRSSLEQHYEFHKDPSNWRFQCSECSKKCSTKQSLQVHMRTHTGEKPFICQFCGEAFAYRHLLRSHVNQRHTQDGIEDLPRTYRKNNLGQGGSHQGRRTDPKNTEFVCDQCSKPFSTKQALQVHGRIHTGEKPFECPVCKEKFRYRHFLRSHINQKHQQDGFQDVPRPYRKNCESGGDGDSSDSSRGVKSPTFKQSNSPQQQNGFGCSQCSKIFSTKQAMQVHFRTHTGEKPFECQVCGERFRYRHVLRTHVNSRHENEGIRDVPRPYNKRIA